MSRSCFTFCCLFLVAPLFFACVKTGNNEDGGVSGNATVFGEWQWLRSVAGTGEVSPATGTVVSLVCSQDSSYSLRLNDEARFSGRLHASTLSDMENAVLLDFGQNMTLDRLMLPQHSRISLNTGESLLLVDHGITDGYTHYFKKVTR